MSKHSVEPDRHYTASSSYRAEQLEPESPQQSQPTLTELPAPVPTRSHLSTSALFGQSLQGWLYPFVWIGLSWGALMLVAGVATFHMIQVTPEPLSSSSVADSRSDNPLPSQSNFPTIQPTDLDKHNPDLNDDLQSSVSTASDSLPFLTLGLVAFSCAIGCFLMSRRSRVQSEERQANQSSGLRRLPRRNQSSTRQRRQAKLTASPSSSISEQSGNLFVQSHPASETATVTVLPSGEMHPLDWKEPSVADNLDLRQHRPLSYWL